MWTTQNDRSHRGSLWKTETCFASDLPTQKNSFDDCVLLTYSAEALTFIALSNTQRKVERSVLGLNLRDHVTNQGLRKRTGVSDSIMRIVSMKWKWAGRVAIQRDERWTNWLLESRPLTDKGRPHTHTLDQRPKEDCKQADPGKPI